MGKNTVGFILLGAVVLIIALNFELLMTYGEYQQIKPAAEKAQKQKKPERLLLVYQNANHKYPENRLILQSLGTAYLHNNKPTQAEYCFRSVLKKKPDDRNSLLGLASILQQRPERINSAISLLREALRYYPKDTRVLNQLGWLYYQDAMSRTGKELESVPWVYEQSKYYFETALKQNPKQFEAQFQLAAIEQNQHHNRLAAKGYCDSLSINPNHLVARYNLSLLLQKLGYFEEAYAQLVKVIILAENDNNMQSAQTLRLQAQQLKNRLDLPGFEKRNPPLFLPAPCLAQETTSR
jgi:Tfp pilus assembly protein PilF